MTTLDADALPDSRCPRRTAQSISFQNQVVGQGTLKLEMRLLRKEECDRAEAGGSPCAPRMSSRRPLPRSPCVSPGLPRRASSTFNARSWAVRRIDSLLADLAAAETASPNKCRTYTRLFLKFKALAIVKPESCTRLGELLTTAEVGSLKMRVLADSLEAAGNAEAQAALGKAIRGRAGDVPALARAHPGPGGGGVAHARNGADPAIAGLRDARRECRRDGPAGPGQRRAALGDESPDRAARIVARLLQELASAASADERWQLLLALGNAGSTQAPALTQLSGRSLARPAACGRLGLALDRLPRGRPVAHRQGPPWRRRPESASGGGSRPAFPPDDARELQGPGRCLGQGDRGRRPRGVASQYLGCAQV